MEGSFQNYKELGVKCRYKLLVLYMHMHIYIITVATYRLSLKMIGLCVATYTT